MGKWKGKGRRKIEESVNIYINVKKNYRKIRNKKDIYIDVKIDKDKYVKLIIYLYIFYKKRIIIMWQWDGATGAQQ